MNLSYLRLAVAGLALLVTTGCVPVQAEAESAPAMSLVSARWEHRPESDAWNAAAIKALADHGVPLLTTIPADADEWCPAYADQTEGGRAAFWVGLLSAMAKHESTWNPAAVGGGGKWFGLVQIAPATARGYGCRAQSGAALKAGGENLSCAVRIMAHTVPRDGVVSRGMRGVAADWGPFHSARKRADMMAWTRAQPYCQPSKA